MTFTLSTVPLIFPAAHNRGSYWVRPYSVTRPQSTPTTPTLLPPVAMQLSQLFLECAQHTQPGVALWISHPPLEYTHHALPPLLQLWLPHLSLENAHHARPSTSCGYVASHQSQEYAHHTQPVVAMWLSHPSLEYAHHAHLFASASCGYVAISPIPGIRTPRPARCGYLAISPIPGVRPPLCLCLLWLSHLSLEYAHHAQPGVAMWLSHPSMEYAHQAHLCANCGYVAISLIPGIHTPRQPGVAMWLSHLSLEYAHHAHLSTPASCGHVAISLIPGVRTPRPAKCGYVAISPIPGIRPPLCICQLWLRGYLTYPGSMPIMPTLLPAVATWFLINPRSTHTTPSQVCLFHLFLEYALHAHPLPAVAMWLSHLSLEHAHHTYPSIRCGYVALPPIPGVCPTHLAICQVWLRGYLPYHLSTPVTPTLCLRRLRSYHIYPWNTPIPLPAAATRLLIWPWNTPTMPSQPQVWLLCGLLTFHQLGFSG